ncbi:MAG TPA: aldehyde dehydrogenase family protein, partial [Mycobacteriales bacterium]|nr:aldehyde dehydrogenase family protein [Mycobacteriales bacterium]
VLDDADLGATAESLRIGSFRNSGQVCSLKTRVVVPRSREREFLEAFEAVVVSMPVGDPTDPDTQIGPLVSERQRTRVESYIRTGRSEGARVVVGGGRPAGLTSGYFVEPTIFADVDPSMTIAQEEIFGPVLCVLPFDDDDDALRIANDSAYGLSGGVFSADEERATRFARRVRTGSIGINGGLWYGADSPYGGYKTSGVGRQNGVEGFEQYLETKAVAWPSG